LRPRWTFDLEDACKQAQIEPEVAKALIPKLEPLLESAMKKEGFYDQLLNRVQEMRMFTLNNLHFLNSLFFEKVKLNVELDPREHSIIFLVHYLISVESFFSDVVDILCFALVAQHHDLADFFRRTYVERMSDLEDLSLADRLRFLSRHGWEEAEQAVDRNLRNSSAHANYELREDGTIVMAGTTLSIERDDFNRKSEALRDFIYGFWVALNKFFVERYGLGFV